MIVGLAPAGLVVVVCVCAWFCGWLFGFVYGVDLVGLSPCGLFACYGFVATRVLSGFRFAVYYVWWWFGL